jgi:Leucine-rich repeat (LRR) protein
MDDGQLARLADAERTLVHWLAGELDRSPEAVLEALLTPPEAPGLVATTVTAGRFVRLSLRPIGKRLRWAAPDSTELTVPLDGLDALAELDAAELELDALDLSPCPALTRLELCGNRFERVDLSPLTRLQTLTVRANELMVLDLRAQPDLWFCDCTGNRLTAIMLPETTALKTLRCSRNQLMVFEPPPTPDLTELQCARNALVRLVLDAPNLRELDCRDNQLTELDVAGLAKLTTLQVGSNRLAALAPGDCPRLRRLDCERNYLDRLAIEALVELEHVDVSFNQLEHLALGRCAALEHLAADNNHLKTLQIEDCPSLAVLTVAGNALTALPLSDTPVLADLDVSENAIEALSLAGCPRLARLTADGNPLGRLDLRLVPRLAFLSVDPEVEVEATDSQRRRFAALREADGRPIHTDIAEMDRWEAHMTAARCDEPDRERLFLPLVRDTERCARGTALMLYWMASPHYYLQFAERSEVPPYAQAGWDLLATIEDHVRSGAYTHDDLFFDPRDDQQTVDVHGKDWTHDTSGASRTPKRTIPAFMTRASGV